jgi:hypothetical protein
MAYVVESQMGDSSFSLEIIGYEFPGLFESRHKANKILIILTARNLEGSWSSKKPALLTWEVEEIIQWARGGFRLEPLLMFVNPSLQLYAEPMSADSVHLQLTLSEDLLPAWHAHAPIILDLIVKLHTMREFAADLESELAKYPYRSTDKDEF